MFGKISTTGTAPVGWHKNEKCYKTCIATTGYENHVGKQGAINFGGFLRIVPQFTHC